MFSVVDADVAGKLHSLIEASAPVFFFHILIRHWVIDCLTKAGNEEGSGRAAHFVNISFGVANIR